MRIIICCSISAAAEVAKVRTILEGFGHDVQVPDGLTDHLDAVAPETGSDKIEGDFLRQYFERIKASDAVLIVNPELKGIPGYIGGNTLIEMAFAHVLAKPLYCLHPIPKMPYSEELEAMQATILNGELSSLT